MKQLKNVITKRIGTICNYYGGLEVTVKDGRYYWGIENYNPTYWQEIPQELYDHLIRFEDTPLTPTNED